MTANIIRRKNGRPDLPAPTSISRLVDQIFQDNLNHFFKDDLWGSNGSAPNVPVNIRETDKAYEMEVVAPGISKEDLKLNVQGDMLTISFEHKEENKDESDNLLRQEYRMQSFSRSFTLDDTVDVNKIDAQYTNGVLKLLLPKKESAQKISRNIQIK